MTPVKYLQHISQRRKAPPFKKEGLGWIKNLYYNFLQEIDGGNTPAVLHQPQRGLHSKRNLGLNAVDWKCQL